MVGNINLCTSLLSQSPNKLFKSDSQRVAFSPCVGFGV
ncbi:hypothetical protein VPUCM_1409 [Vibrio parahaemolyticus UCM-V493]|nr:hypothetical protein VPUCM_1409 [Vibrio parahaemolyticus UCM-V493]